MDARRSRLVHCENVVELVKIRKAYSGQIALDEVSLSVPANTTTVLLGTSGCGKSTLLRTMIGLVRPDSGSVRIRGIEFTDENSRELRQSIGYVIQEGGLFPLLTARQNLALLPKVLKWPTDRTQSRILELSRLTHFPLDKLDHYPQQLSGGQRQRVSLMRALMLDPDLLLLDEPLGALDPIVRRGLQEELRAIFRQLGKTVVLVTHDLGEAGFFGDSIALMHAGSIVQRGSLSDLVRQPASPFVEEFVNAQRSPLEALGGQ